MDDSAAHVIKKGDSPNQLILDVPLFVPETFIMNFSVMDEENQTERRYSFQWTEATVQDMLQIIYDQQQREEEQRIIAEKKAKAMSQSITRFYTPPKEAEILRSQLTKFLVRHITEGDPEQLRSDMKLIPLISQRQGLDLQTINNFVNRRIKKNELEMGVGAGWLTTRCSIHQQEDGFTYEGIRRSFQPRSDHAPILAFIRSVLRCIPMGKQRGVRSAQRKKQS